MSVLLPKVIQKLAILPMNAQTKKTLEGEKRSAIVKMANNSVPIIKPNCTEEVKYPKLSEERLKFNTKSFITALPANHREVQQNCATTMSISIFFKFIRDRLKRRFYSK